MYLKNKIYLLLIIPSLYLLCVNGKRNNPSDEHGTNYHRTVTDADGNIYQTIKLGDQIWTTENLRTTKFNDGISITLIDSATDWEECSSSAVPAYCFYNKTKDINLQKKYGALYNWYAVNTGKLAPLGWRVADTSDWNILKEYLSNPSNKIAKSLASTTDWETDNTNPGDVGYNLNENNHSGFSAFPGGYRYVNGNFNGLGEVCQWWSSTKGQTINAFGRCLKHDCDTLWNTDNRFTHGFSVRLIKD